jgi:2-polyprenyl-6-methoxyphenol hydroxylase-like FAD-dependent oxidoreductase
MAWVPEGTNVPKDRLAIWSPVPWDHHSGRATLAGDAAHAMTYHRRQGLNNCLNDAANLVAGLVAVSKGEKSIDSALTAYGEEVVIRGAAEVEMSRLTSMGVHNWKKFHG